MSTFLRLLKYSKYIGHLSKHILIDDFNTNFRSLSHVSSNVASTRSKSDDRIRQYKDKEKSKISSIDDIIKEVDDHYKKTGIIPKHFMEQIIQHVKENTEQIKTSQALLILGYNSFLPQCRPEERVKLSTTLWKLITTYRIPVNVSLYNALLQIYIKNDHKFSPLQILTDMKRQRIRPNNTTYKYLLQYFCKNGDMLNAATVLECMKEENCPINESILNLLILGYSQASDLTGAINILDIMEKKDIIPSEETYTAVMCAYAKVNDVKKINKILAHCKEKGIKLSNQHMLDVMYALIVNNNTRDVDQISTEIKNLSETDKIYFLSKIMDTKQEVASEVLSFILPTERHENNYNQLILFYIIKLINNNLSSKKIIEALIRVEEKYKYGNAFSQAILCSYQFCNNTTTLDLLKAWKARGHKLRPHYFWPVLTKLIEKHDVHNLLYYIKEMITTYDVTPCVNTLTNFFVPYIFCNVYDVRNVLYSHGMPYKIIDNAIVYDFLRSNKIRRAAAYISLHRNVYEKFELKDVLIQALHVTCDISSFFVIVRSLYEKRGSRKERIISINDAIFDMSNFLSSRPGYVPQVIKYLCDNQWKISEDAFNLLSYYLRHNLSSDASKQLSRITENRLVSRTKDGGAVLSYDEYISSLDSLLQQNLIEEAIRIFELLVIHHPFIYTLDLVLDKVKYLISLGYFNDAVKVIEYTSKRIKISDKNQISSRINDLLTTTIAKGNEKEISNIVNALTEAGYLASSENLSPSYMTVYIERGDATNALEIAELLCEKFQYIPDLTKLTELIITAENTNLLQRFIDITAKVYEPQYILGELLVRFLEKGYEKEAKRITELFVTSNYKFTSIKTNISMYDRKKNTKILLKLLDWMKEARADTDDRLFIYKCLFDIYNANNDYQSGSLLWKRMTEEGMLPSEDIERIFENLKKHNDTDERIILT